uniref:SHC (Src homology 2 domain containing) transforming protein 2 n=1 Tax=Eptatretus burgeri TaxID=7764 RepID=A0A8C4Q1S5_EPTBU
MLQRPKYSRFRNDSVTSVDEHWGVMEPPLLPCPEGEGELEQQQPALGVPCPTQMMEAPAGGEITEQERNYSEDAATTAPSATDIAKQEPPPPQLPINGQSQSEPFQDASGIPGNDGAHDETVAMLLRGAEACPVFEDDWQPRGSANWPHPVENIQGGGITYLVKYLGSVEVLQSMRSLDFNTRTQVTREAITRVCDTICGTQPLHTKKKPPCKVLLGVLGHTSLRFSGRSATLLISLSSVSLSAFESKQIIASHHMQSVSFASGGDVDMADFVAYVAKDRQNQRACHVLECGERIAQQVIGTIGQAFELRFRYFIQGSQVSTTRERAADPENHQWGVEEQSDHKRCYYNAVPGKDPPLGGMKDIRSVGLELSHNLAGLHLLDIPEVGGSPVHGSGVGFVAWDRPTIPSDNGSEAQADKQERGRLLPSNHFYVNTDVLVSQDGGEAGMTGPSNHRPSAEDSISACSPTHDSFDMKPFGDAIGGEASRGEAMRGTGQGLQADLHCQMVDLQREVWYHGDIGRKEAESLLRREGDFLVRASSSGRGQFVLTGLQCGQPRHILLVNPEGVVRTKGMAFDNINHLINYHHDNRLPIVSGGSELCLIWPIQRRKGLS